MEYTLYYDEGMAENRIFGNSFGGCIVSSKNLVEVVDTPEKAKQEQHLFDEIK